MTDNFLDMSFGNPKSNLLSLLYSPLLWMDEIHNDLMSKMAYIMNCHACVKSYENCLHVMKWMTSLDMVTKPLYHQKMKVKRQHKDATKTFDYTTIADRLGPFNCSDYCHPTGVFQPVYGITTFPLTTKAMLSKGHTFKTPDPRGYFIKMQYTNRNGYKKYYIKHI